jgi:uncharacterized membrane protein
MAENETMVVKSSTGMEPNLAALLSYVAGVVTGIIFWVIEKDSSYVKFHAMQSTILFGGWFVLYIILGFIPVIGWIIQMIGGLGILVLWILLMIKAYGGERFKLPVIGDIAERQAGLA